MRLDPLDNLDGLEDELDLEFLPGMKIVGKLREIGQEPVDPVGLQEIQVAPGLLGFARSSRR